MAISPEEFNQITQIVHQANETQFERFSEKLELTVNPIKENLVAHTAHDEKIHTDMYDKLSKLANGQSKILGGVAVLGVIGGAFLSAILKGYF